MRVLATVLGLLLIVALIVSGVLVAWQRDTAARRREATEQTAEKMDALREQREVRKQTIAKERGWPWPPPAPQREPTAIVEEFRDEIERRVDEALPPERSQQILRTADEKYGLYEKGDKVSVSLRGGVGVEGRVSGTLYRVTPDRVQIGRRWFNLDDLVPEERVHFEPVRSSKLSQAYVAKHMAAFKKARATHRRTTARRLLAEHGYVPPPKNVADDSTAPPAERWIPVSEAVHLLYEEWLREKEQEVEAEAFRTRGFVREGENWVRPNPWYRLQQVWKRTP